MPTSPEAGEPAGEREAAAPLVCHTKPDGLGPRGAERRRAAWQDDREAAVTPRPGFGPSVRHSEAGDDLGGQALLTLPVATWALSRERGHRFSLSVEGASPDLWRFRFAPTIELHVRTDGAWSWHGARGRASRLILPLVREAEAWLTLARGASRREAPRPGSEPSIALSRNEGWRAAG